jgi:hypothetical protein
MEFFLLELIIITGAEPLAPFILWALIFWLAVIGTVALLITQAITHYFFPEKFKKWFQGSVDLPRT